MYKRNKIVEFEWNEKNENLKCNKKEFEEISLNIKTK